MSNKVSSAISDRFHSPFFLLFCFLFTICLSILVQPVFVASFDYENYEDFFRRLAVENFSLDIFKKTEPLFVLLSYTALWIGFSYVYVYSAAVTISLWVKILAIRLLVARHSDFLFISFYYFSRFFPIHELTQIRASIAAGFILYSWSTLNLKRAKLTAILACLFHYSALAVLPFLLFFRWGERNVDGGRNFGRKNIVFWSACFAGFVFVFSQNMNLILGELAQYSMGLDLYVERGFGDDQISFFSISVLLDFLFLVFVFSFGWRYVDPLTKRVALVFFASLLIFMAMASMPTLAFRIRELFAVLALPVVAQMLKIKGVCRRFTFVYIFSSVAYYIYTYFLSGNAIFFL